MAAIRMKEDGEGFDPFPDGPAKEADSIPDSMFFRIPSQKEQYGFLLPVGSGRLIKVVGTGNSPDEAATRALERRADFIKFLEQ